MKHRMLKLALACSATLAVMAPAQADTYAATHYPIVLAHGLLGFEKALGIDYFYGIAKDLRSHGATVYETEVSAVNSSDVRGEQFVSQLQQILAVSGAQKVNLIGHSQGNQTVRYAAAALPGRVASVTSVDGVTFGSAVADDILKLEASNSTVASIINGLLNAVGSIIDFVSGNSNLPQDAQASLTVLSSAGAAAFNARFPAGVPSTPCAQGAASVNGVAYYSWTGIGVTTNVLDISDVAMALTSTAFGKTPNDGLVAQCAAHLGTVIRDNYAMNHLDAVNQVLGLVGKTDPVALFRQQANRLKLSGL
jgi:triacylglycerol lipase